MKSVPDRAPGAGRRSSDHSAIGTAVSLASIPVVIYGAMVVPLVTSRICGLLHTWRVLPLLGVARAPKAVFYTVLSIVALAYLALVAAAVRAVRRRFGGRR